MRLADLFKSILRRWYVFAVGVAVTIGCGWGIFSFMPPTYEASGSILLMPATSTVGDDGNPYMYLDGMRDALDVLVRRSTAADVRDTVSEGIDEAGYTVQPDATTSAPVVVVTATASSAEDALSILHAALVSVDRNLKAMQDEVQTGPSRRIGTKELVVDSEAEEKTKDKLQLAIVVVAGGLVGTAMLTSLLDGVLISRRLRGERLTSQAKSAPETSHDGPVTAASGTATMASPPEDDDAFGADAAAPKSTSTYARERS